MYACTNPSGCRHWTFFIEDYRGMIESFITWCNDNHAKLNISKTNELVVDYSCMSLSVWNVMSKFIERYKNSQSLLMCSHARLANKADPDRIQSGCHDSRQCSKYGCCWKEAAASRWAPKISVTNSVSHQMWNMVTISPSAMAVRLLMLMSKKKLCS